METSRTNRDLENPKLPTQAECAAWETALRERLHTVTGRDQFLISTLIEEMAACRKDPEAIERLFTPLGPKATSLISVVMRLLSGK